MTGSDAIVSIHSYQTLLESALMYLQVYESVGIKQQNFLAIFLVGGVTVFQQSDVQICVL